jgi:hypothetical protein
MWIGGWTFTPRILGHPVFPDACPSSSMVTFDVSDVTPGSVRLPQTGFRAALGQKLGRPIEAAASALPVAQASVGHPFVDAVSAAFRHHLPLVLSPDDVWLCLTQAIGAHVELNAEALRERFVRHAGTAEIVVRRDGFVRGSPDNDWGGVFAEFAARSEAQSTDVTGLFVADFSTTGPVERAASNMALLAALKSYFDLAMATLCGIPRITLLGQARDWLRIRDRVERFEELGLGEWLSALRPALDAFASAAQGEVDRDFWRSFFKWEDRSGGAEVSGWVNALFPYVQRMNVQGLDREALRGGKVGLHPHPNPHATRWRRSADQAHDGPRESEFGSGLVAAPLTWHHHSGSRGRPARLLRTAARG